MLRSSFAAARFCAFALVVALLLSVAGPALAREAGAARKSAAGVRVRAAQRTAPGLDAGATQPVVGHIKGTARDASGTPIPGVVVATLYPRHPADGVDVFTVTRADGTYDLAVRGGTPWQLVATGDVTYGKYYDALGRSRYATPLTVRAGRSLTGIDFTLVRKDVRDASSALTTAVVPTRDRPVLKATPYIGGDRVTWTEPVDGLLCTRVLGSPETTLTAPSRDGGYVVGDGDANSRYLMDGGSLIDLASGVSTRVVQGLGVWSASCDEHWAVFSLLDYNATRTNMTNKVVARDLDSGATRTFDFGQTPVVLSRGAVSDGHATVVTVSDVGRGKREHWVTQVRMLDLVHGTVSAGAMTLEGYDYGLRAVPYGGRIVYLDPATSDLKLGAPNGSWSRTLLRNPSGRTYRYALVGDGHRVMFQQFHYRLDGGKYTMDGSVLKTFDLRSLTEATVAVQSTVSPSPWDAYDVSGDRFVWTGPSSDSDPYADYDSGATIRSVTASDLSRPERIDDEHYTWSNPGHPLVTDSRLVFADDRGRSMASGYSQADLYAKPLTGGLESLVATDVKFDDAWAPVSLSGDRVAYGTLESGSGPSPFVTLHVADVASHETSAVVSGIRLAAYWGGGDEPGWPNDSYSDLAASGDWVYYIDYRLPTRTNRTRQLLKAVNAATGEKRIVATSNYLWDLGRLVPAGGGRVIYATPERGMAAPVRVYDPSTAVSMVLPRSWDLQNRPFVADYPDLLAVGLPTSWPGRDMDGPLTLSSMADGSTTLLDRYTMAPWSWANYTMPLALDHGRLLLTDRVVDTRSRTYYALGLESAANAWATEPAVNFFSTGGSMRGDTFALGFHREGPTMRDATTAIVLGDLSRLPEAGAR